MLAPSGTGADADHEVACAKLNLTLHVVGRRDDGYHLLESLVAFTREGDVLRFAPAETLSLCIEGPFSAGLENDDSNLVVRAAKALGFRHGAITLDKRLPVASGIGGGSADAAAALRGLIRRHGIRIDPGSLDRTALSLGADVPVCLRSRTCFMSGIGEHIREAPPLPALGVVLANPKVEVSTAAVFRALGLQPGQSAGAAHPPLPDRWQDAIHVADFIRSCRNDLEPPARTIAPVIGMVLDRLEREHGCLVARMSGSGATCFGLFPSEAEGREAAERIRRAKPHWWVLASGVQ
ncbi:4-(cytidine 5'-diphospho)-2-C-methyl-D-erythritol kinase [Rhodoligotrophos defluvii]|uniref:4-(cytidine 5'-diphospho)-2-C-methyl-D-erythritol kinase n=1 Tax=Rhodoligotrophos defluvii TaxID=2561934 RepID=UPI0019609F06|nr:4-(cytidine 5'-diphospho)-2-C-methyl-D-erythritol kinase [Rhodoligotrophos defluvii]